MNKLSHQDKLHIIQIQIERMDRLNKIAITIPVERIHEFNDVFEAMRENGETDNDIDKHFEI